MAGEEGFEPTTYGFGDRRSNQLSYTPTVRRRMAGLVVGAGVARRGNGVRSRSRTDDTRIFSPVLYQLSYPHVGGVPPPHRTRRGSGTPPRILWILWWKWSERQGSNLRPLVPQTSALPGCATLRCAVLRGTAVVGRGGGVRTHDLLFPKQARYQTAPRPVVCVPDVSAKGLCAPRVSPPHRGPTLRGPHAGTGVGGRCPPGQNPGTAPLRGFDREVCVTSSWTSNMVGAIGFEPTTYGTQNRRATRLRYTPMGSVTVHTCLTRRAGCGRRRFAWDPARGLTYPSWRSAETPTWW